MVVSREDAVSRVVAAMTQVGLIYLALSVRESVGDEPLFTPKENQRIKAIHRALVMLLQDLRGK